MLKFLNREVLSQWHSGLSEGLNLFVPLRTALDDRLLDTLQNDKRQNGK